MHDEKDILDFIKHFSRAKETFLDGCCYWFAHILSVRFGGDTYYDPISGHFLQKIRDDLYDVRGKVTGYYRDFSLDKFSDYQELDPLLYSRLVRDCVEKRRNTA